MSKYKIIKKEKYMDGVWYTSYHVKIRRYFLWTEYWIYLKDASNTKISVSSIGKAREIIEFNQKGGPLKIMSEVIQ